MRALLFIKDPNCPARHNTFLGGDWFEQGEGWEFNGRIRYTPTIVAGECAIELGYTQRFPSWGKRKIWWQVWKNPEIVFEYKKYWAKEVDIILDFKDERTISECDK